MRSFEGRQGFDYQPNNTYYQNPQFTSTQSSNFSAFDYGNQYSPLRNQYSENSNQYTESNAMYTNPVLRNQDPESYYRPETNQFSQSYYQRAEKPIFYKQNAPGGDDFQSDDQNYYPQSTNYTEQYSSPNNLNRSQASTHIPYSTSATNLQPYSGREKHNLASQTRTTEHDDSISGSNSSHNISGMSSKRPKKPLVVMKIDIGGGQVDELLVFDGDDPLTVAEEFCRRNNLDLMIAEPLEKNIKLQLANYRKKREERERQRQLSQSRHEPESNSQPSTRSTNKPIFSRDSPKQSANLRENPIFVEKENPIFVEKDYPTPNIFKRNASAANIEKERAKTPSRELSQSYQKRSLKARSNSTKSLHSVSYHNPPSSGDTGDSEQCDDLDTGTSEEFRNAKQAIFNRLYRDAIVKEQRQNQLKEAVQMEKKQKEMADATFRPKINKSSVQMAEKRREFLDNKWQETTQVRNQVKDDRKKTPKRKLEIAPIDWQPQQPSIQVSQSTKYSDECPELTFAVPVGGGPKSAKNATSKEVYNRLYQDAEKKDAKQLQAREAAKKEYSFKPMINKKSEKLIRANNQANTSANNSSRSHIPKKPQTSQKERSISAKKYDPDVDPKTGQKLFQPNINKQNKYYQAAKKKEDKAFVEEVVEVEEGTYDRMLQKKTATNPKKSIKEPIINAKKSGAVQSAKPQMKDDRILRIIFDSLDADRDGVISADNVDITQINANVLETISEILFMLEDQDASYDFSTFKKLAIKLGLVQKLATLLESDLGSESQV